MTREPAKGGFEQDVFSRWRKFLYYTQRPGVCKKAKKQNNRRFRKGWKWRELNE
jgi:hypothetical protein